MSALTARWTTPAQLNAENRAGWMALLSASLMRNPFYGPDFLLASEAHLTGGMPIRCLVIEQGEMLVGLLPLRRPALTDGQFGCFWQLYTNPYLCLTDPLLDAQNAQSVLGAALKALREKGGPHLLRASQISETFSNLLAESLPEVRPGQIAHYTRAALSMPATGLPARSPSLDRKKQKLDKIGLSRTRLEWSGTQGFQDALEEFLHLEAKGWKGISETALRSTLATTRFAREAFSSNAVMECLRLDGKLIAGNLGLVSGGTVFTVKTAYDPDFAKFSPGLLLDTDYARLKQQDSLIQWLDSCANPGHPLEQHWPNRISITDCVISLNGNVQAAQRGASWVSAAKKLRSRILHPV